MRAYHLLLLSRYASDGGRSRYTGGLWGAAFAGRRGPRGAFPRRHAAPTRRRGRDPHLLRRPSSPSPPVHSTNLLERLGTELKRRSAVVGIFSHRRAVLRLWGDLRAAQHDEWRVSAHRDRNETSLRKLFIHEAEEGTPAGLLYWVADTGRYPSSAPACTDCARPSTNTQVRRMVRQVEGTMAEENKDIAGVIALPPLIYLGPLVVGLVLHAVRPIAIVPRVLSRVLGVALIGSALAVGATAFAALRRADTPPDPREPTQAIVATGPYRFRACPQTSHLSPSRFDRSQDPLVPSTHDPASTSGHPTLRTRPRAVPEGEQPHEGGGRVLRRPPQPPMWSPLGRKRDLGAGGFVDTLLPAIQCTLRSPSSMQG